MTLLKKKGCQHLWESSGRLVGGSAVACTPCNYFNCCLCCCTLSSPLCNVGSIILLVSAESSLFLVLQPYSTYPSLSLSSSAQKLTLQTLFLKLTPQHFQFFHLPPACHSLWLVYRCFSHILHPPATYSNLQQPVITCCCYHLISPAVN